MKIALDYDGTYDQDPALWQVFIRLSKKRGHDIRVVTHRHETLDQIDINDFDIPIIYTDGVAKKWYCEHREPFWVPDVWIDDKPKGILENGPLTQDEVLEWRKSQGR